MEVIIKWKEYFPKTKKTHIVTLKPCPSCGIHQTPQPVSEKVAESCRKILVSTI